MENRFPISAAFAVALLASGTSLGQGSAASGEPRAPRVVVLDLPQQEAFATLGTLDASIEADFRDQGFSVISPKSISAALGADEAARLTACSGPEAGCDAALGAAMKADYVARGEVRVAGGATTIALSLEDSGGVGVSRAEATVSGKGVDELRSKLLEMVPQLVQPVRDSGRWPTLVAAAEARASSRAGGAGALTVTRVATYALAGVGGLGLVAGAVSCLFYPADLAGLKAAADGSRPAISSSAGSALRGSVVRDEAVASVGFSVGVAAIGVSIALQLLSGPGSTAPPANLQFAPAAQP